MSRHAMSAEMAGTPKPAKRAARRRAPVAAPRAPSSDAISSARDLARAGQHQQAVDVLSKALQRAAAVEDDSLALLELRAESLAALGEMDRAMADAETMQAQSERSGRSDLVARALIVLARLQVLSSNLDVADRTAELAVKTARKSRNKLLVALALSQARDRTGSPVPG